MKTLVDCGCKARIHADGRGIEIDYCTLHSSAQALLEGCQAAYKLPRPWIDGALSFTEWDDACERIEYAISRATLDE